MKNRYTNKLLLLAAMIAAFLMGATSVNPAHFKLWIGYTITLLTTFIIWATTQ